MSDPVNHPNHYNWHPTGVECIDIIRPFTYNRGTAIAYIWRAGRKPNCDEIEDLKKAVFHLQDEIKSLEKAREKQPVKVVGNEVAKPKEDCPTVETLTGRPRPLFSAGRIDTVSHTTRD